MPARLEARPTAPGRGGVSSRTSLPNPKDARSAPCACRQPLSSLKTECGEGCKLGPAWRITTASASCSSARSSSRSRSSGTRRTSSRSRGANLGYTLAKLGYVTDDEITSFLSQQYRVPTVNLEEYEIDAEILKLVPKEPCERHKVHPRLAHRQRAHRRDGRPDEPQRHRRSQVPHRLQHRAGRRERDRDPRRDREVLQRRPLLRRGDGGVRREGNRLRRRRGRRQPHGAREGERGRARRQASST